VYEPVTQACYAASAGPVAAGTAHVGGSLILETLKSGRLFGYLARPPGNRATIAR